MLYICMVIKKIKIMATKIKGTETVCKEWAKHLRKWGKKAFWGSVRVKERQIKKDALVEI